MKTITQRIKSPKCSIKSKFKYVDKEEYFIKPDQNSIDNKTSEKLRKERFKKSQYARLVNYFKNRNIAFKRDNYTCQDCGFKKYLHAHHIIYRSRGGSDSHNNLITLCIFCHAERHKGETAYHLLQGIIKKGKLKR